MIDEKKIIEDIELMRKLTHIDVDDVLEIIDNFPKLSLPSESETKWIPCSELLPNKKESSEVLVTYLDRLTGKKRVDIECYFYGVWCNTLGEFEIRLAWQPKPEPY